MDARAVLETVRTDNAPADWQVLHAKQGFFVGEAVFRLVMAFFVAPFGILLSTLTILGWSIVEWGSHVMTLAILVGILSLVGWAVWDSIRNFRRIRTARDEVLILTPEGCVHGNLGNLGPERQLVYAETLDISLLFRVKGRARVLLDILPRGSRRKTWYLDDRFGPAREVAQWILRDYTCYTAKSQTITEAPKQN